MSFLVTYPSKYTAAYSPIPLTVVSSNNGLPKFKYVVNVCYDSFDIASMSPYSIDENIYTSVEITGHTFVLGDSVFIYTNQYMGYYIVQKVIDANNVVLDFTLGAAYDVGTPSKICKYFKYKTSANPGGLSNLDISNTLKDFVSSSIEQIGDTLTPDIFDASSTRFSYFLVLGEEYQYELEFEDNGFFGGTLGFNNSSITSLTGIPFKIGDRIKIEQNLFEWSYDDNFFSSGSLGFTSVNPHNWEAGDLITVTGQVTESSYNGPAIITSVPDAYNIVVDKQFISATPTEGGSIFGQPKPEYNTDALITNIYIDPTYGLIIETNLTFSGSSLPIGGKITYLDNTVTQTLVAATGDVSETYNARFDRETYNLFEGDYTPYVYDVSPFFLFSTIYFQTNPRSISVYKENIIDLNAFAHILTHSINDAMNFRYTFYSSYDDMQSNNPACVSYLDNETGIEDIYIPIGVVQLLQNVDRYDEVGYNLSSVYNTIKYYKVELLDGLIPLRTLNFKVDDDCVGLPTYDLVWKDALGSFITYPFKYAAKESTDVERSNYYTREGKFEGSSFSYTGRGETTFFTKSRNKILLTSGWLKEQYNYLFEDLMKSTEVFIQTPEKVLLPVTLEANSIEYKTNAIEQVINYSFEVKFSYNDYRF